MTISEQIREAALYFPLPVVDMTDAAFDECYEHRANPQQMSNLSDTDCRTFMLLVAEALK